MRSAMPAHTPGKCAKAHVVCTIVSNGLRFVGTNGCANAQKACPRLEGEGYAKCKSICRQEGHAEEVALRVADRLAMGGTAYIEGHERCCDSCRQQLLRAGVKEIVMGGAPE